MFLLSKAGNISDHYPVEVELETVQKAAKPKKKALPRTRKTSPKGKDPKKGIVYFVDNRDL